LKPSSDSSYTVAADDVSSPIGLLASKTKKTALNFYSYDTSSVEEEGEAVGLTAYLNKNVTLYSKN
jgi:hypothetical protein